MSGIILTCAQKLDDLVSNSRFVIIWKVKSRKYF